MSADDLKFVKKIKSSYTFLMAGTIEPRKGHLQTIAAFEILWKKGVDVNLLIVGKEGWLSLPESSRRTIPKIVNAINNSTELNKKLFWLNDASDDYLLNIYEASACLIAASEDEGFGLPLIEAARNNLPIIAREISVFREVAGDYAFYFDGLEPKKIANAIEKWLKLYSDNLQPRSAGMDFITWKDCIYEIYRCLNFNNEIQEVSSHSINN
jgi:glycosyltransferase involved in cell wall biosynthesis